MEAKDLKSKIEARVAAVKKNKSGTLTAYGEAMLPVPRSYYDCGIEIRTLEWVLKELENDKS